MPHHRLIMSEKIMPNTTTKDGIAAHEAAKEYTESGYKVEHLRRHLELLEKASVRNHPPGMEGQWVRWFRIPVEVRRGKTGEILTQPLYESIRKGFEGSDAYGKLPPGRLHMRIGLPYREDEDIIEGSPYIQKPDSDNMEKKITDMIMNAAGKDDQIISCNGLEKFACDEPHLDIWADVGLWHMESVRVLKRWKADAYKQRARKGRKKRYDNRTEE